MKQKIIKILRTSLIDLGYPNIDPIIQKPKHEKDADFATNIAFILSKKINKNPVDIAKSIKHQIESNDFFNSITVAGPGFINLKINPNHIVNELKEIISSKNNYGKNNHGEGQKVLVEFVSANPTGPLTVGHGRGAILGDVISNIYTWNGYKVDREYYYNNAGRQMRKLGESVYARYLELCNQTCDFPEGGYKGKYIIDIASKIKNEHGTSLIDESNNDIFKNEAESFIFKNIKNTLKNIRLEFDSFYNENDLYESKKIDYVIEQLKKKNLIYKKDGALWYEGTKVGRDTDRVLIKSTGEPTYRLPDMAYHTTKFDRGYDICVDIFGADHMDAYPDILSVLEQLGYSSNKVKVLIHQFISILQDGKPVKMSTREANFITLNELIEDVGADVVRYFFIMRNINSHLNFDLKIAKEKSENNPVYYIQYCHARISNLLNKSDLNKLDLNKINLNLLIKESELRLIQKLVDFNELILKLIESHEPQLLANYLHELASMFHKYYAHNRILNDNKELSNSRLVLSSAVQIIIKNGLNILGISQPDRM